MKIYVINLQSADKRRRHIVRLLDKYKLDYELIEAVDGRLLSEKELSELCDMDEVWRRPEKLTAAAIGCALSHLAAYKKMAADDLNAALVLEDDAVVPPDFDKFLGQIEKQLKTNEIILLHYFQLLPDSAVLSRRAATTLTERFSLMYPVKIPRSGAAYVVSKDAARSLADARLPIRAEADDWNYFHETGAVSSVRCVYPMPVRTAYVETQIQTDEERAEKQPFQRRITGFIYDREIPVLYDLLMRYRAVRNDLQPFQPVDVVDEPSYLQEKAEQS